MVEVRTALALLLFSVCIVEIDQTFCRWQRVAQERAPRRARDCCSKSAAESWTAGNDRGSIRRRANWSGRAKDSGIGRFLENLNFQAWIVAPSILILLLVNRPCLVLSRY